VKNLTFLLRTISKHAVPIGLTILQNIICKCALKGLSFWGTSDPGPLPGLCPWCTPLGDFRPRTS